MDIQKKLNGMNGCREGDGQLRGGRAARGGGEGVGGVCEGPGGALASDFLDIPPTFRDA